MGLQDGTFEVSGLLLKEINKIKKFGSEDYNVVNINSCLDLETKVGVSIIGYGDYLGSFFPENKYLLTRDLDCKNTKWKNGSHIEPRHLMGVLDGQGYSLKNLKVGPPENEQTESYRLSLFQTVCVRCEIANIKFENIKVVGHSLLVAENRGRLSNVYVSGTLIPSGSINFESVNNWDETDEANKSYSTDHFAHLGSRDYGSVIGGLTALNSGEVYRSYTSIDVLGGDLTLNTVYGGIAGVNEFGVVGKNRSDTKGSFHGIFGGLVGINVQGRINSSSTHINISIKSLKHLGGIAGIHSGLISCSQSRGDINIQSLSPLSRPTSHGIAGMLVLQELLEEMKEAEEGKPNPC